jgi:hypothetical protein
MKTGWPLFIILIGAILTYAVHGNSSHVDLQVVGFIFMATGMVALVLSFVRRKKTTMRTGVRHRENSDALTEPRDPDDTPPYWQEQP